MAADMVDLSDVRFVKRIVVGSDNAGQLCTRDEVDRALALLNQCLNTPPAGRILGIERSFTLVQIGEHQVVLQWLAYHLGFPRKPPWLAEGERP